MKSIAVILLLFVNHFVFAETNWQQSLSLGLNINDGNTDSELYNLGFSGEYKIDAHEMNLKSIYNYGKENDDKSIDNSLLEIKYHYLFNPRYYVLIISSAENDDIAGLNHRYSFGPGLGFKVYDEDNLKLKLEAGISYVEEEYDASENDDFAASRLAEIFEYQFVSKARLKESLEYIGNMDESEDYIIKSNIAVETVLTENLNIKLSLNNVYTNQPAAGKEDSDTFFSTMLVYNI